MSRTYSGFLGANGTNGFQPRTQPAAANSSWSTLSIPGATWLRSTVGPTPSPGPIDFRARLPPFAPRSLSCFRPAVVQQPAPDATATAASRIAAAMGDDLNSVKFSEEIWNEANMYFQQIYSLKNQMPVSEFLNKLKALKNSPSQKDHDVLACIVKILFEEYRFFNEYPERELRTTAEVYGGIIREGIISNLQFATAVRNVIESLQFEPRSMLFAFGILSLNACKTKLYAYPKICQMIASQESFSRFPQVLKDFVSAGVKGQLPSGYGRETPSWVQPQPQLSNTSDSGARVAPPSRTGAPAISIATEDTLVNATEKKESPIKQPPDSTTEKVASLFNSLSPSNLPEKTEEMKQIMSELGEDFIRWLAQYIVMKRVIVEQNFQPLYSNLLVLIGNKQLELFVKQETFKHIKILLRSGKRQAASKFGARRILKNLGLWLGAITIARDRPITSADLNMKSLLIEAYYDGEQELLFVVPFIANFVGSCSKSAIFGPNCPWIRAILHVFAELRNEPDLNLSLKFEIDVLSKDLKVDLQTLNLKGILNYAERLLREPEHLGDLKMLKQPDVRVGSSRFPSYRVGQKGVPDSGAATVGSQQISEPVVDNTGRGQQTGRIAGVSQSQSSTQVQRSSHFNYHDINTVSFDGLVPHIKMPASLPLFQMNPKLKHVVRPAINHAIKELIGPVTERAIEIAMHTTEHISRKDFALDPDEQRLRCASHHMIRAMTAGMASVTSRDPLATTLQSYLKQAFISSFRTGTINPQLQKLIDEATVTITDDNIELATNFIAKTACEKAAPEMDKRIENELLARREARLERRQYVDPVALARAQQMPEKIRLRVGPVTTRQMAIYDEFSSKICGFLPMTAEDMITDYSIIKPSTPTAVMPMKHEPGLLALEHFTLALQVLERDVDDVFKAHGMLHFKACVAVAAIRQAISELAANPCEPVRLDKLIQGLVEQILYAYQDFENFPAQQQHSNIPVQLEMDWNRRLEELFVSLCAILLTQMSLQDLAQRITRVICECRRDYRFNVEAIGFLAKHSLIQLDIYDQHLAMLIGGGSSFEATLFAQRFLKLNIGTGNSSRQQILERLPLTLEQLSKIQQFGQNKPTPATENIPSAVSGSAALGPESPVMTAARTGSTVTPPQSTLPTLIHSATVSPNSTMVQAATAAAIGGSENDRGSDNNVPELQSKVEMILRMWIQLCYTPMAQKEPKRALAKIVHVMHEEGVLSTDEMITRFFRLCTEMCVDVSYRLKNEVHAQESALLLQPCYYTLDAFVKLICLMVKHSDGSQHRTKISLLKKVLNIIANVLHLDHDVRGTDFHAMPYHRILIIMFSELTTPDPVFDPIAWNILEAFGQALFILQPRRVPGFAYAWLDIVGHRNFIARLLKDSAELLKTSAVYIQLIICHMKFLSPFLRNVRLPKSIATMYMGTLRVLLVILHDFPELLCEYHYVICDAVPPNCIQLRNLILSAYPANMRLPDPFSSGLKVDSLVEMMQEPKMHINMSTIIPAELRIQLDDYLATRSCVDFHANLPGLLQVRSPMSGLSGSKYNTTIMNAIVLYVGMRAVQAIQEKQQSITLATIAHTAYMDIFRNLAISLCSEGRYLLFNAIANQLRYPNSHTLYFSCTLLYLFLEANTEVIQEQITRILFERLVALRPHPWGLLVTFIELTKNPSYSFWKHEFVRCAPEIERLFQSIAKSCMGSNSARSANANIAGPHGGQCGGVSA